MPEISLRIESIIVIYIFHPFVGEDYVDGCIICEQLPLLSAVVLEGARRQNGLIKQMKVSDGLLDQ